MCNDSVDGIKTRSVIRSGKRLGDMQRVQDLLVALDGSAVSGRRSVSLK